MSTDIIHFKGKAGQNREFKVDALKLFLTISIPLMFATFLVWAAFHFWEKRRERRERLTRDQYGVSLKQP